MRDLKEAVQKTEELLRSAGVGKYAVQVSHTETRELNTELNDFTLFRTIFDCAVAVTVFRDGKKGSAAGNDLSDEGLYKAVAEAAASADSAEPDEAHDIAPDQGEKQFEAGSQSPDMERFHERLTELIETAGRDYPKVRIMQVIGSHEADHTIYRNSNGTKFDTLEGCYHVTLEFSAFEGDRGTGLSYTAFAARDLDTPFMELADVRRQIADAEAALTVVKLPEKFEGKVLFMPRVLGDFAYILTENYLSGERILSGESQWLDKIGQQVASSRLTLRLQAQDDRLTRTKRTTEDGYVAENVTLIENGVLKSHRLNLYVANKTGRPVTKNSGYGFVIEPGGQTYEQLLSQIDRGLIVGGFSGGEPGANGEFSGVAKNSFYVENGKVLGAVNEVMISGNLAILFEKLLGLSDTLVSDETMAMPCMLTEGVVIS